MTDDLISDIAKRAAHDLYKAIIDAGGDQEDVVCGMEFFAAFIIGATVKPGHDRELLADVAAGIAGALTDFRMQTATDRVRH